jgi:hypothetical protein
MLGLGTLRSLASRWLSGSSEGQDLLVITAARDQDSMVFESDPKLEGDGPFAPTAPKLDLPGHEPSEQAPALAAQLVGGSTAHVSSSWQRGQRPISSMR